MSLSWLNLSIFLFSLSLFLPIVQEVLIAHLPSLSSFQWLDEIIH